MYQNSCPLTFDKQILVDYNNEKITFTIPKKEKVFLLEAKWGATLCFSNTPFEDLFFIFIAILLETTVVFLSKNASLLTSTMYFLI